MKTTFFDCNVCLGQASRPAESKIETVGQLLSAMDRYEVAKALVYHKETLNNPQTGNEILIREIDRSPRLTGCAAVAPAWSGEFGDIAAYFTALHAHGIRAIRLFPRIHNFLLAGFCLDTVLEQARRCAMPVIIDELAIEDLPVSTWSFSPDLGAIYTLAMEFSGVNFIVLYPGMLTQRMVFTLMARCCNVFFECSSFGYKNIEYVCEQYGAEKLIFGTGFPILDPGAFLSDILHADIDRSSREKIASRNLERLLEGRK